MNLLIDVGNTRIKSALGQGDALSAHRAQPWRDLDLNEVFAHLWSDHASLARIVVSHVAGEAFERALDDWLWQRFAVRAEFVRSVPHALGVTCAYPDPTQLGVDRWVAVQAAAFLTDRTALVIDCGTATTVDLLTHDKIHRGGAILPGVATMRRALAGDTANLNVPDGHVHAFADNTRDAIAGGTAYAVCGAIDRLAHEAQTTYGDAPIALITGGEAELVRPLLTTPTQLIPELVLQGLAHIAQSGDKSSFGH